MKLRQALIVGLSSVVLALPAVAAESRMDLNQADNLPAATLTPSKKEATPLKKAHKKVSLEKKARSKKSKEKAKLDELNTLNSQPLENRQAEKGTIKL